MNDFADFLHQQINIDLELLRWVREDAEAGTPRRCWITVTRGFRECELKTRLLHLHQRCGTGTGPCDGAGEAYPPEDERGCHTRAALGLPYADRPGYKPRWRP